MTSKKMAALGRGGWVKEPPITKQLAEAELETEIPDEAWSKVRDAFKLYGRNLNDLEASHLNNNPNDAQGWTKRELDTKRRIQEAISALDGLNKDFLAEAVDNLCLQHGYGTDFYDWRTRLNRILDDLVLISFIVENSGPLEVLALTKAESRKRLAHDIYQALKPLGAKTSNGWFLAQEQLSYADLTPFERLIELMNIHQGDTPNATSKWVREALARNK